MATTKPRITVTLEPHHHELLRRLAGHQGQSMSAIMVELLETVAPVLERVCVAIEGAKAASDSVRPRLKVMAEKAEADILPFAEASMSQLDMFIAEVMAETGSAGEDVSASLRTAREEVARVHRTEEERTAPLIPPASNTGEKSSLVAEASAIRDPRPVITGVRSRTEKRGKAGGQGVSSDLKKSRTTNAKGISKGAAR